MAGRHEVAGVVLAGGLATRMGGGDKTLIEIAGEPMLSRVTRRLRPQVAALALNANGDPERFAAFDLPVVPDTVPGHAGPLAGILAGMRWARAQAPGARYLATVAGDTPFFPADLVERLGQAVGEEEDAIAIAASTTGVHPVFGLWPLRLAEPLERFLDEGEERKIMAFAERFLTIPVAFEHLDAGGQEVDPFFNVNTPEEAKAAGRIAGLLDGRG